jgi:hypothetical protein
MKRPIAPPLLDHRVARVVTWATLWLLWAGAVLAGLSCCFRKSRTFQDQHYRIKLVTRFVLSLLVFRALVTVPSIKRAPRAYGPNARRRVSSRARIGATLRKQFRNANLLARIAKLSDALHHPEKYTRAIAARLERNFMQVVRIFAPALVAAPLSAPFALSEAALDSS